jgi:hypothetical protein
MLPSKFTNNAFKNNMRYEHEIGYKTELEKQQTPDEYQYTTG